MKGVSVNARLPPRRKEKRVQMHEFDEKNQMQERNNEFCSHQTGCINIASWEEEAEKKLCRNCSLRLLIEIVQCCNSTCLTCQSDNLKPKKQQQQQQHSLAH